MIPIKDFIITTTKIVTSFTVNVIRLDLFESVTLNAMLYGADGNFIEVRTYILSGTDYDSWANDDTYLIDKIAEKLGCTLIKASHVVPEPVSALTSVPEPVSALTSVPEPVSALTGVPEPVSALTGVPEPVSALTGVPEPISASTVVPEPVSALTSVPEPVSNS